MMYDIQKAKVVEVVVDDTGKLWINVDNQCQLRIGEVNEINIELSYEIHKNIVVKGKSE